MTKTTKTKTAIDLETIVLSYGAHSGEEGQCLLEATALLAGESKTDSPACASEVLAAPGRVISDGPWRDDAHRTQHLLRFAKRYLGTRDIDSDPALCAKIARAAATMARKNADEFDPNLTPAERVEKNGPALLDALFEAAGR